MNKSLISLVGLSLLCASGASFAGHADKGAYVDLGAGYGKVNIENAGKNTIKNKGLSGTANLGYQFTPHLALEAGATSYRKVLGVRDYNAHVAVKGIVQLSDKVDVFAKVGAAEVHAINARSVVPASKNHVAPYVGAGLSYWLTENLAATVQAEATTKHKNETPAMYGASLGLTYKF